MAIRTSALGTTRAVDTMTGLAFPRLRTRFPQRFSQDIGVYGARGASLIIITIGAHEREVLIICNGDAEVIVGGSIVSDENLSLCQWLLAVKT